MESKAKWFLVHAEYTRELLHLFLIGELELFDKRMVFKYLLKIYKEIMGVGNTLSVLPLLAEATAVNIKFFMYNTFS